MPARSMDHFQGSCRREHEAVFCVLYKVGQGSKAPPISLNLKGCLSKRSVFSSSNFRARYSSELYVLLLGDRKPSHHERESWLTPPSSFPSVERRSAIHPMNPKESLPPSLGLSMDAGQASLGHPGLLHCSYVGVSHVQGGKVLCFFTWSSWGRGSPGLPA